MLRFVIAVLCLILAVTVSQPAYAGEPEQGIASHYGPGGGVATQWCTWTLRHTEGCGQVAIRSSETGKRVIAPVIDWCQCYRGTADERIIDLQWGVVKALGLPLSQGLYPVTVQRIESATLLPNTSMER